MIWLYLGAFAALVVFGLDFLLRRKKWSANTAEEKASLILGMVLLPVYLFCSALGLFLGITGSGADTAIGELMYTISLPLGTFIFVPSAFATVGSIIFRKKGKARAAKIVHFVALGYIVLVMILWMGSSLL